MKGIVLIFLVMAAAYAAAVDSFDYHCADIGILQNRAIQNDIGITQKQRDQMNHFAEENRSKLEAYQKQLGGKKPDTKVLSADLEALKKNVIGVMSAAQVKRLRELNLQAAGLLGLLDPIVGKKIGMSDAEQKKFDKVYADGKAEAASVYKKEALPIAQKYRKLALPYQGKEKEHEAELKKLNQEYLKELQEKVKPKVDVVTKSTATKLESMLTKKEKATWLALQGKKFVPPKG